MTQTRTKGITISVGGNVGQVVAINGLGIKADTVEITDLGDAIKRFCAVIAERGEMTLDVIWDPEAHDDVEDLVVDQLEEEDPTACNVTFPAPAAASRDFNAWVTAFDFQSIEPGNVVRAQIGLKPTGE